MRKFENNITVISAVIAILKMIDLFTANKDLQVFQYYLVYPALFLNVFLCHLDEQLRGVQFPFIVFAMISLIPKTRLVSCVVYFLAYVVNTQLIRIYG